MELLSVKGLVKDFKGLRALDNVNIDVHEKEIFGLIGPNGSGKTTLLNVITGFLQPTAGEILFKGKPITGLKPHEVAKRRIVRTFQLTSVYPGLTVEQNIITGSYLKSSTGVLESFLYTGKYRREKKALEEKAREILAFTGMEKQKDVLASNLAFGDERRLEIGIALATDPELLLMDEPAAGMNPEEQSKLMHMIQLLAQKGITMIVVEHNMKVIMGVCTSIACLCYGKNLATGNPEEICCNEEVISVYLGKTRLG